MATPVGRPIERDVAGDIGRQPVGRAHRGALGAQHIDGASGSRRRSAPDGRRSRSGQGRFSRSASSGGTVDLQTIRPPWPSSASSSSPARQPAASRRLALALAQRAAGTVINADAMQTYDAFPILTAQPTAEERAGVPHRLYGVLPLSARRCRPRAGGRWRRPRSSAAWPRPHAHPVRRLGPLSPDVDAGHRRHSRCARRRCATRPMPNGRRWAPRPSAPGWPSSDPAIVARLKPGDRQRHVRAWEVFQATGRPLSAWQSRRGEAARLALRHGAAGARARLAARPHRDAASMPC